MACHNDFGWSVYPERDGLQIRDENETRVAFLAGDPDHIGNVVTARLIAAAPDLLAVLEKVQPFVAAEISMGKGLFSDADLQEINNALCKAKES